MPCIDAQTQFTGSPRRNDKTCQTVGRATGTTFREGGGIRLGVQLYAVGAGRMGSLDTRHVGVDKDAHPYAPGLQPGDKLLHTLHFLTGRETTIGRGSVDRVRYERRLLRQLGFYNLNEIVMRIALDVELAAWITGHQRSQRANIIEPNMSLVRSRMNRNAGSASIKDDPGRMQQVWPAVVTAVSEQSDAIDIGGKMSHGRRRFANG